MYCLGDPGYGKAGFLYGGTSTKWLAQFGQAPTPRASMVSFDKTVDVMRAVGCETVKAEIRPDDPTTDNGTAQRAQLFSYDEKQGEGGRATFGVRRGDTWYYGFAFSTNDGYRPQGSSTWPDWNNVFIWHGTNGAPACGIALTVATKRNLGGIGYTPFADGKPHLALDIWGNSAADPRRVQEWHFYDPKPFEAGRRYRVAMKVLWGDSNTGGIQWWVDGRSLTDWVPGISNMAAGFGLYPIFQNYRPANSRINNAISWTNSVYYGGLVRGSSLRDVSIP